MNNDASFSEFIKILLMKINDLRKKHSSPSLEISAALEKYAIERAKEYTNTDLQLLPPVFRSVNEMTFSSKLSGQTSADPMIMKIENKGKTHIFSKGLTNRDAGAFVESVWLNSRKIGIGCSSDNNLYYIVMLFYPDEDIIGKYTKSVFKKGTPLIEREISELIPLYKLPTIEEIKEYFLESFNKIRKIYKCDQLEWSDEIAQEAFEYSEKFACLKENDEDGPIIPEKYGMNVIYSENGILSPTDIMKVWSDVSEDFSSDNYNINESDVSFLNMISKSTKKIGVGIASKSNTAICIAFFFPKLETTDQVREQAACVKINEPINFEVFHQEES